jgi:hypothetical protein
VCRVVAISQIFIKPIHDNNYLTKSEMNSVFSNVETLRDINMELMKVSACPRR